LLNRVERYTFENGLLDKKVVIIDGIPGAPFHDGGRMVFGPDGYLYIATGDATEEDSAQDIDSLSGKILRLTDQGEIPGENPFQNEVFSYGHRNPQGLSFDDEGNLWSSEHGRSGILSGLDEINIIVKGGNYGWPIIQGLEEKEGMIVPVLQSGGDVTWAPGDVIWVDDVLFYPGLRGEALYKVKVNENLKVTETEAHFFKEFGRLRTVVLGPDDDLYVTTSNRDGRGKVREGDDKVIRVKLNSL
jgi:glucose/arabinose dehydrogenase